MEQIGLIFDFRMVSHHSYQYPSPELPSRLHKLIDYFLSHPSLKDSNNKLDIISSCSQCLDEHILLVHSKNYLNLLRAIDFEKAPMVWYLDTYLMKDTLECAYLAVGAIVEMVDRVQKNQWKRGFALVRPPGHHVGLEDKPNGFCIFNNVAIAAQYLIKNYGLKKVLIFDWDVHHGDGTQEIFYNTDQVLFISLHRYDQAGYYPAKEEADFTYDGGPLAKGFNINIPWDLLPEQTATTDDYIYIFERVLAPIIKSYAPEIVLVSAGFDSAKGDPLGGLAVTNQGYAYLTKRLMDLSNGKVLVILEGGYNLKILSQSANAVLEVLMGEKVDEELIFTKIEPNDVGLNACKKALEVFNEYWPALKTDERALSLDMRLNNYTDKGKIKGFETSGGHAGNFKFFGDKIAKLTGIKEAAFYKDLYSEFPENFIEKDAEIMKTFLPKYFGREFKENEVKPTLILENLLINKDSGSLLDIKIGFKGWLKDANPKKKLAEMAKCRISISEEFGFRIAGMTIKDKTGKIKMNLRGSNSYMKINKENLRDNIKNFFLSNDAENINKEAMKFYIYFMEKLECFLEEKCRLNFAAVSLFFILDNIKNSYDVKLIDFSYWEKAEEKDVNIINGIKNLRKIFEEFLTLA